MATQYTCGRCGKKLSYEERVSSISQVRYRKGRSAMVWESKWYDLCDKCARDFEEWFHIESKKDAKGDDGAARTVRAGKIFRAR